MRIAVCLKEVIDARLPLKVDMSAGRIIPTSLESRSILNPADRAALDSAMRLKEQKQATRVEAFSVCGVEGQEALWYSLARGADYAERLRLPIAGAPYTAAALALRLAVGEFDLICCGDETLDNSSAVVGPLLAELMDLPQVTSVVQVRECTETSIVVERGLERGHRELVEMELPGLLTLKPDSAEPHYVSFRRLQEVHTRSIPVRQFELSSADTGLIWPKEAKFAPPRARVKKAFTPDARMSPAERMRTIMAGGLAPQEANSKSPIIEGDPEYVAEQLFRFLKHHEFV